MEASEVEGLLGVSLDDIKGTDRQRKHLLRWLGDLVRRNGEAWIKEHKQRLLDEWDHILSLGM